MEEVAAHAIEHRPAACDDAAGSTHHQRQRAGHRMIGGLADRTVDHRRAARRDRCPDLARGGGIDRAHVDVHRTRANPGDDAVGAERDALDIRCIGQHRDHDLARGGNLARRARSRRPVCGQPGHRCRLDIGYDQAMAAFQNVCRHRPAHRAESYETDDHDAPVRGCALAMPIT